MTKTILAFLFILAAVVLSGTLEAQLARQEGWKPTIIQEDDPRWDCHTMGNRICGPGSG